MNVWKCKLIFPSDTLQQKIEITDLKPFLAAENFSHHCISLSANMCLQMKRMWSSRPASQIRQYAWASSGVIKSLTQRGGHKTCTIHYSFTNTASSASVDQTLKHVYCLTSVCLILSCQWENCIYAWINDCQANFLLYLSIKIAYYVCRYLGNMLSSHTCFSEKQHYSQLFYFKMCIQCQNICYCFGLCDSAHCQFNQ